MMGEYDAGYEHYIDGLHREIIDYQIEVEQVKSENAKLRELVRDMEAAFFTQKRHEEIVRCRDCAYCEKGRDGWHVCNRWNEPLIFADGDGFCACGERRDA